MDDHLIENAMAALQRRLHRDGLPTFANTRQIVAHALLRLYDEPIEHVVSYWLDHDRRLLDFETLAIGSENEVSLSTRYIARRAVLIGASCCVMCHNHPGTGADPTPSGRDKDCASSIDHALAAVGVLVLGHHVVSATGTADIRTGAITQFANLPKVESDPGASYCPHCAGRLETV